MIKHHKILAIIGRPIILGLYSWMGEIETQVRSDQKERVVNTEVVPDHILTAEYRLILEKTYLDLYGSISEEMQDEDFKWLGYCIECGSSDDTESSDRTLKRCGDKVEWGGNTFCLIW